AGAAAPDSAAPAGPAAPDTSAPAKPAAPDTPAPAGTAAPDSSAPAAPASAPAAGTAAPNSAAPAEPADPLEEARLALEKARAEWQDLSSHDKAGGLEDPIDIDVTAEAVSRVVSDWTGIPAGRLAGEEAQTVSRLAELIEKRIQGQSAAVEAVTRVIQASKAGLKDPAQPLGVFLLAGPSGVGKTETGLALADLLFGDEKSITTINMSEFQEAHTVSRLVGSPPGYVGYGEGGLLTEAVRRRPYSVVLLDECEKAHIDVMNLFYQVFDKGVLTDAEGQKINFANTIIMLTTNLGSDIIEKMSAGDPPPELAALTEAVRPVLNRHFQPALLARMNIVPYRSLDQAALEKIAVLKLTALAKRAAENSGIKLTFSPEAVTAVAARCFDTETGARNIDYILSSSVMPQMAREILAHMSSGQGMPRGLTLDLDENQAFRLTFEV
ncbi:MAG: AAA family ATPase, partial [Deltaproteobacteria bacterium]|nr:AAA family ATPase [Deltaproteobacteria bacterium]